MSEQNGEQDDLSQILNAIQAVYHPRTSNEVRQAATEYLENAKRLPNSPELGFTIAIDTSKDAMLRHYGLQMLEHYIKYKWDGSSGAEEVLRDYVLQLAQASRGGDPPFVRNKVAQLWTELAKRSWGLHWMDMDGLLVTLWHGSPSQKSFVLGVLEALSEEVFSKEDSTAAIRGDELADACLEIFTPASALPERSASRLADGLTLRHGDEGWMTRLCLFLESFFTGSLGRDRQVLDVAQRTLKTLRSTMYWISAKAMIVSNTLGFLYEGLKFDDDDIRTVSVDSLNTWLNRLNVDDEDMVRLISSRFEPHNIQMLRQATGWAANLDPVDIDQARYAFLLKLGELTARLGGWLDTQKDLIHSDAPSSLPDFFSQMWALTTHPSLMTSRSIMTVWIHLLRSPTLQDTDYLQPYVPLLLEHCTSRLVRFEALSGDHSDEPILLFLDEDLDTLPEKHAFLGNYRRYCVDIIEVIVRMHPLDAVSHILQHSQSQLQTLTSQAHSSAPNFSRNSPAVVAMDSQFIVVDAAVKGYFKWNCALEKLNAPQIEEQRTRMQELFKQWCEMAFSLNIRDPEILRRFIPVAIIISTKVLPKSPGFAVFVAKQLLDINLQEDGSRPEYSDAVKSLQHTSTIELQRLALTFADAFLGIYNDLERTIQRNIASGVVELRPRLGYQAFLLIIVQRATQLGMEERVQKMREILEPVKTGWLNAEIAKAADDFSSFCACLGLAALPDYLNSHDFAKIEDWSSQQLDQEGLQIQQVIMDSNDRLPIRLTRVMLAATTEKVEQGSPAQEAAQAFWAELMPTILPNILKLVSQAQSFYNPENWSGLPDHLRRVMKRISADRFWQVGISAETRDDFFNKVNNKTSYDGLASAVRGSPRQVRETCYAILDSFSRFKSFFYSIPELPEPLSQALFSNATYLSPHHFNVLLRHAEGLISRCPVELRAHFLPPFLASLFQQTEAKLSAEWAVAIERREQASNDDDLGDEMKLESTLRQVTGFACALTAGLLEPQRTHQATDPQQQTQDAQSQHADAKLSQFVLTQPRVLGPILLFAKSALQFRDTRAVSTIIRTLRSTIPTFKSQPQTEVQNFLTTDLLQSAVISLHNPYFYDIQRELALLIAQIIQLDPLSSRTVILQLPGMAAQVSRVDKAMGFIRDATTDKQSRAWVLELLKDVRGLSIQELGKMERVGVVPNGRGGGVGSGSSSSSAARLRRKEALMAVDEVPGGGVGILRGGSPTLDGIAGMFGDV